MKHKTVLNNIFSYAEMLEMIINNPMDRVIAPKKTEAPINFFSNDELKKILHVVEGTPIETPVYIAIFCGFRRGEVLGVRWRTIDFDAGVITMQHTITKCGNTLMHKDTGKTKSSIRTVKMPEPLSQYLFILKSKSPYIRDEDYVCRLSDSKSMRPDYLTRSFKNLLFQHSLPAYTFHTLRHSSATYLLTKGYQLKEIQGWLGHKNIESTNRYAHLQFGAIVDMANAFNDLC